jgi:hypothetical protein
VEIKSEFTFDALDALIANSVRFNLPLAHQYLLSVKNTENPFQFVPLMSIALDECNTFADDISDRLWSLNSSRILPTRFRERRLQDITFQMYRGILELTGLKVTKDGQILEPSELVLQMIASIVSCSMLPGLHQASRENYQKIIRTTVLIGVKVWDNEGIIGNQA